MLSVGLTQGSEESSRAKVRRGGNFLRQGAGQPDSNTWECSVCLVLPDINAVTRSPHKLSSVAWTIVRSSDPRIFAWLHGDMQSESGSRGNEDARAHEARHVQVVRRAETQRAGAIWQEIWEQTWARRAARARARAARGPGPGPGQGQGQAADTLRAAHTRARDEAYKRWAQPRTGVSKWAKWARAYAKMEEVWDGEPWDGEPWDGEPSVEGEREEAWRQAQINTPGVWERWAHAHAEAKEVWERARAEGQAEAWEAWARAEAEVQKETSTSFAQWKRAKPKWQPRRKRAARAAAREEEWEEWAQVEMQKASLVQWERSKTGHYVWALWARGARADVQEDVSARARAEGLVRALDLVIRSRRVNTEQPHLPREAMLPHPHQYGLTPGEVLADLEIKGIIDSIKPNSGSRLRLARLLWGHSEHQWLVQIFVPVTRLPLELLQSILYTIIDDASHSPVVLMLVCKHWYTTVTGIWAPLKLGTRTPKDAVSTKLERKQWLLDIVVDTEIDRGDVSPSEAAYGAVFAVIGATSRWRSLVLKTFPGQTDLPDYLVNRSLQLCPNPTMSRLRSFEIKCPCEMSPLLDRLLRILGTTASPELTTVEIPSANVISFLVPAYSPIFRSVKVLFLNISGTHDPVDLLPHLHQLETLTASHLSLPTYAQDINLPFVNTLRHLTLRAVSIQWMSGRTFGVLESCIIRFPLHRHMPHIFSTTLPNCEDLTFQGYPLDILDGVSAQKLIHLSVTSPSPSNREGVLQLIQFSSQVLGESRLAPRIVHISIEATSQAWVNALTLMPHLEELVIGNARPSSLRAKVVQSLIAQPVHVGNTGAMSTPEEWDAPLCPSLRRLGLKYHRWLRPSEHFDLIPDLVSIIMSRERSNRPLQSFWVWLSHGQKNPLELSDEWRMSSIGFEWLAHESRIKKEHLLDLIAARLVWITSRSSGESITRTPSPHLLTTTTCQSPCLPTENCDGQEEDQS